MKNCLKELWWRIRNRMPIHPPHICNFQWIPCDFCRGQDPYCYWCRGKGVNAKCANCVINAEKDNLHRDRQIG